MIKVVQSDSFNFDMPAVALVNVWSRGVDRGWLQKRASVLTTEIGNIRPEPGHQYLHLISMGAMDHYGANRNGDGFNEKAASFELPSPKEGSPKVIVLDGGLIKYHNTFSKHAHVFKHHKNTDPSLSIGKIAAEAYNPEMRRGELIIKVPENGEWMPHLQKLAEGEDIPFSMACRISRDICSVCGNKARSRNEYCDHLRDHMTEITKEGHQVFAINDCPIFFDISRVFKPADRIAYSLRKVASAPLVKSGAQLAEELGVSLPYGVVYANDPVLAQKIAAAQKYAEMEKMIDTVAQGDKNTHIARLLPACPCGRIPGDAMKTLRSVRLGTALQGLADAKICLSLEDFIKLVMGNKAESMTDEIEEASQALPGLFNRLLENGEAEECAANTSYDSSTTAIPQRLKEVLGSLSDLFSLDEGPALRRMRITIIRGDTPRIQAGIKAAAVSGQKSSLLNEYAAYQLSFSRAAGTDDVVRGLAVLRGYVR